MYYRKDDMDLRCGHFGLSWLKEVLKHNHYIVFGSIIIWSLLGMQKAEAQKVNSSLNYIIRGKISEAGTGEPVIGANIYTSELKRGVVSNPIGEYFLRLPPGRHVLQISSIGYHNLSVEIDLSSDTLVLHSMEPKTSALEEVIITGTDDRIKSLRMGQNTLDLTTLKRMPPLLGEPDIIRGLLLMPGVTTVGEGATGFNVRGGSVDQNLVILDDAPIYNTSHLFGFLTAFNSNAVLNADLYKGSIPANYGGRVASVLDVKLRQGNSNKFSGNAGIGLMAGNLTLEGPIIEQRTTFLFSGRSSYSDWLLRTVPEDAINQSRASFYDITLKVNHRINKNNLISFTTYRSHDNFKFPGDTTYAWSTQNFTLKLGSTLSPRLFVMTTLVSSGYAYKVLGRQPSNEFNWEAGINNLNGKLDATLAFNEKSKADFGIGIEKYNVDLGSLRPLKESNINPFLLDIEHGLVSYAYYTHQFDIHDKVSIRGGVRASLYELNGPGHVNEYEYGEPKTEETFIGTKYFHRGEHIQRYQGIEPRFSIRFSINARSSVKAGFDRTLQYLHLISNTSAISPIDLWKLSDPFLKPQQGSQYSIGYFRSIGKQFDFSLESFFKKMDNVVDYKDGGTLLLNDRLESDLLQGEGRSYGMEWMIEKKIGQLTGWLAYTFSRTERRVAGENPEETINKGKYFPSNYDKPHTINVTASYAQSKWVSFGLNFVYASGRPLTYPGSSYVYDNIKLANFEERNNERGPAYHRLDLSFEVKSKNKANRKWKGTWIFSVYNVYARKNAYSIFFRTKNLKVAQPNRLAVIGTAIPSLSYSITF